MSFLRGIPQFARELLLQVVLICCHWLFMCTTVIILI